MSDRRERLRRAQIELRPEELDRVLQGDFPLATPADPLADFLVQLEIATVEETPLYEVPNGSVDLVRPPVRHGPWPAGSCAAVLARWHRAGWLGLYLPDHPAQWDIAPADWCDRLVDGDTLTAPDAEELLAHPERWRLRHADGHVAPYQTEAGRTASWEQWRDEVRDLARRLPLD
ncbi:hypothetical protein [Micromonospora auratinigra]|uniref:Uncharacterized protein n=1 Tax=Micromonospora auratinigra TaxID=261654 RepID=A0A1A8ZXV1_9ACTN|nr:hypothetical protein [Micromonospora auratinigra]SBT48755.1 hypothetical protein GA0070611_4170 [Micromonospora auratinigra]